MASSAAERVFFPWVDDASDDTLAWIDDYPAVIGRDDWKLHKGITVKDWLPEELTFDLAPGHGTRLGDSIPNLLGVKIVSRKLKRCLEESGAQWEFFPVRLRDRKRRLVNAPYYLANLLGKVPCMDAGRSKFEMDTLIKTQVLYFERLELDLDRIPDDARIFRLGEKTDVIIARRDLAHEIRRVQGCDGLIFQVMEDYGLESRALDG